MKGDNFKPIFDPALSAWWPQAEAVLARRERPARGSEESYAYLARETEKAHHVTRFSPKGFL